MVQPWAPMAIPWRCHRSQFIQPRLLLFMGVHRLSQTILPLVRQSQIQITWPFRGRMRFCAHVNCFRGQPEREWCLDVPPSQAPILCEACEGVYNSLQHVTIIAGRSKRTSSLAFHIIDETKGTFKRIQDRRTTKGSPAGGNPVTGQKQNCTTHTWYTPNHCNTDDDRIPNDDHGQ